MFLPVAGSSGFSSPLTDLSYDFFFSFLSLLILEWQLALRPQFCDESKKIALVLICSAFFLWWGWQWKFPRFSHVVVDTKRQPAIHYFFLKKKLYFSITILIEIQSYWLIEYNLTYPTQFEPKNLVRVLL